MYFNSLTKKYIATFDEKQKETKHEISTLNDIYNFSKELADIIEFYDKNKKHPFGCSEILNNQIFLALLLILNPRDFLLHSQHEYKIILILLAILFFTECYKVSYHSIHITKSILL